MRFAVLASVLVTAASPLLAQTAPDAAATAAPTEERKICKRMEQTGSRMGGGKRVCHTAAEWRQLDTDSVAQDANGGGRMRGSGQN